jgi:hypothetical protein
MMVHPVTGEEVPDPSDRKVIYKYLNARPAVWPVADYIVSNPPFLGNARMREVLGDGYSEALRKVYKDLPNTIDFVMYWWHKSAILASQNKVKCSGLITTNTMSQARQRIVVDLHQQSKKRVSLVFAISDHPWIDGDAMVRTAMTVIENDKYARPIKFLGYVSKSNENLVLRKVDKIQSDLSFGAELGKSIFLKANSQLSCRGVMINGDGFLVSGDEAINVETELTWKYVNGRDLVQKNRGLHIINASSLDLETLSSSYPQAYQILLERVKPKRSINRDSKLRDLWWKFERPRPEIISLISNLSRYVATTETAKHRVFQFLDSITGS